MSNEPCFVQAKANATGASWLENAVVCYMQAIRHGSAPARAMMPRILTLFSFHDSTGAVTQAIRKNSRQVHTWLMFSAFVWPRNACQQPRGLLMTVIQSPC